jgi:hypothetical protein
MHDVRVSRGYQAFERSFAAHCSCGWSDPEWWRSEAEALAAARNHQPDKGSSAKPLRKVVSEVWSDRNSRTIELLSCGHQLLRVRPGVSAKARRCYRCAGLEPPSGKEPI